MFINKTGHSVRIRINIGDFVQNIFEVTAIIYDSVFVCVFCETKIKDIFYVKSGRWK